MVSVNNEWSRLREIIVGTIDNANMPTHGKDLHCINYATDTEIPKDEIGFWDKQVYDETQEDLENLSSLLTNVGVKVHRPSPIDTQKVVSNGYWETTQYYTFCPRDTVTVIGNNILESPMSLRSRQFETDCFRDIFIEKNGRRGKLG
jgi:N-dimethylarginine dimethylaminohydrolase